MSYCTAADLPLALSDIDRYDGKRLLSATAFELAVLNVMVYHNSGGVSVLYCDGKNLGDPYTKVPDGSTEFEWWYNTAIDALYIAISESKALLHEWSVAAETKTTQHARIISDASEELSSRLDNHFPNPLPRSTRAGNSRSYDRDVIKATAILACVSLVSSHDPLAKILEPLRAQVDSIITGINTGVIRLSFERTPSDGGGEILAGATNASTTGYPRDTTGACSVGYDKIKIEIVTGGTVTLNSENTTVTYKATGRNGASLLGATLIDGGWQTIGAGLYVQWSDGVYVAGDYWYLEATNVPSSTGKVSTLRGYR